MPIKSYYILCPGCHGVLPMSEYNVWPGRDAHRYSYQSKCLIARVACGNRPLKLNTCGNTNISMKEDPIKTTVSRAHSPSSYWSWRMARISPWSSFRVQRANPSFRTIISPEWSGPTKRTVSHADFPSSIWTWWVVSMVFCCLYIGLRIIHTLKGITSSFWKIPIRTIVSRAGSSLYWSWFELRGCPFNVAKALRWWFLL